MAVWIYAYGKNGLISESDVQTNEYLEILNSIQLDEVKILDSIAEAKHPTYSTSQYYTTNRASIEKQFKSMTSDEYKAYLDSIKLPFIEIDKIIDLFIADAEKREREKESNFHFAYQQFNSKRAKSKWESDSGFLVNKIGFFDLYEGIKVNLVNDLVWITGPFSIFSVYSCFQKTISKKSREYYHAYFKNILHAFESDFILYAHEWSGLDDEEDKEFNLTKLKEQSKWEITSSDSIHTMDGFYYERL